MPDSADEAVAIAVSLFGTAVDSTYLGPEQLALISTYQRELVVLRKLDSRSLTLRTRPLLREWR